MRLTRLCSGSQIPEKKERATFCKEREKHFVIQSKHSRKDRKELKKVSSFLCPFCGNLMSVHSETESTHRFNFWKSNLPIAFKDPYLSVTIMKCPNEECGKETVFAYGTHGYISGARVSIYPQSIFRNFPEYVPAAIREDYEEACSIVNQSPKSAATLSRRCLQGMIHDFWNIHSRNLNAEITQLKEHISASQWAAIDAVRSVGNIGAHMEHDVNLIVDIEPDEAKKLIKLIELLIEKWYISRYEEEMLFKELKSIGDEKLTARNR